MKTRNYIIAIASLILVSMMIWFSCEKEDILPITTTTETIELSLSDEVKAYLSESELKEFYEEVESVKANLPPIHEIRLVSILMKNKVRYTNLYSPDPLEQINFIGTGFWNELGEIRYAETVVLLNEDGNSEGNGAIYLQKKDLEDKIDPIAEAPLFFESSLRKDITHGFPHAGATVKGNERNITEQRFHSKFNFTKGGDIFEDAFGKATKLEIHNPDRPGYCKGVIYGYVVMKAIGDENDIVTAQ